MIRALTTFFLLVFSLFFLTVGHAQNVVVIDLDTPIYTPTADYVENSLQKAKQNKASCVVLKINTPGGLLQPTRKIVGAIMQSPIPIIAYVAPSGAHAGSAGAFIALSANRVSMAPGTNIGAAHPVSGQGKDIEGELNEKITNDALAFMRSIAEQRDRDFSRLQEMITNSRSFSGKEALENGTIDLISDSLDNLLTQLDGKKIAMSGGQSIILNTINSSVDTIKPSFKIDFLNLISTPDVMYIFLLIGLLGILFEIFNPGALAPGVIGVFCLILAGYGMTLLPVNFAGLALILLAMGLFILEIKVTSYGLLSLGGVVSLGSGALFLIDSAPSLDVVGVSWAVIIISVVLTALFFIFIIGLGIKAQFDHTATGKEQLIGKTGKTLEALTPDGQIRVNGEIWKAVSVTGNIAVGTPVEVVAINNFQLNVKPVSLDF